MDQSLLEALKNISVYDFVWTVSLLIIVAAVLVSQKHRISSKLNKWRKTKNKEEEFRELVYNLKDLLTSLKEEVNNNKQESLSNRTHDREDSRKIRDEMYKIMNKQSEDIESLTKIVLDMKAQNSKTKRAEIKEKIERIYSECHPAMTCTDMQLETLRELIDEYEVHGGVNSFVHSTVEPEMVTWNKILRIKKLPDSN